MELIKPIVKVGNSAGVILPREWLNGKAKVELIEKPINIKKDVLEILGDYLDEVIGIYLVGSYARGEEDENSDVDVIAVTSNINKMLKHGKYDIMIISKEKLDETLKENAVPLLPMLKEADSIINEGLLDNYKGTSVTEKNLRYHLETTKSALNIIKEDIKASKELKQNVSDASAYSLILRLRTFYIIDCIKENKLWKKQEFLGLVKRISGSLKAYERYISVKNDNKLDYKLPVAEAEKLVEDLTRRLHELENV
jgi:predicted nucleotidyltransferase